MSQFKLGSVITIRILSHPWNVKNALSYGCKLALSVEENRKTLFSYQHIRQSPAMFSVSGRYCVVDLSTRSQQDGEE